MPKRKLTIHDFFEMKKTGKKVTWLTSYDFPTAQFAEAAGLDMLLVGDSLGMCVYGFSGTVPVTMAMCIAHCRGRPERGAEYLRCRRHAVPQLPGFGRAGGSERRALS